MLAIFWDETESGSDYLVGQEEGGQQHGHRSGWSGRCDLGEAESLSIGAASGSRSSQARSKGSRIEASCNISDYLGLRKEDQASPPGL